MFFGFILDVWRTGFLLICTTPRNRQSEEGAGRESSYHVDVWPHCWHCSLLFVFMCLAQLPRRASAYDVYQNRVDPGSSPASRRSSFRVQQDDDIGGLQQQKGERAIPRPSVSHPTIPRLDAQQVVSGRGLGREVRPVLRSRSNGLQLSATFTMPASDAHFSSEVCLNGWKNTEPVSLIRGVTCAVFFESKYPRRNIIPGWKTYFPCKFQCFKNISFQK